jgi:hypothetical protein
MFFLLRCVFWLGLTFTMIDWPDGPSPFPDSIALTREASNTAGREIASRCAADPQACLEGARKVEALRNTVTR